MKLRGIKMYEIITWMSQISLYLPTMRFPHQIAQKCSAIASYRHHPSIMFILIPIPYLHSINATPANNRANEAHTTPAITPALSSLALLCLKFWILSQLGRTCTFRSSDAWPGTSSWLIMLCETPRTLISYIVSAVRFGIKIWNIQNYPMHLTHLMLPTPCVIALCFTIYITPSRQGIHGDTGLESDRRQASKTMLSE